MKVENHDGKGNPYHNDATGEFSSPAGTPKKTNITKNRDYQGGVSTEDVKFLKDHGIYDDYKKKQAEKITTQKYGGGHNIKVENLPNKDGSLETNKDNFDFQDMMKELSNSALIKMIKFVWSGFDFNKFKSKNFRLNNRVFGKQKVEQAKESPSEQVVPEKVSDDEMQQLHQEGLDLIRKRDELKNKAQIEYNHINVDLWQLNQIKNEYEKKFGKNKKQFQNWYRKSNLFKKILNAQDKKKELMKQKENPKEIQKEMDAYKQKEQNIKNRILVRNKMLK